MVWKAALLIVLIAYIIFLLYRLLVKKEYNKKVEIFSYVFQMVVWSMIAVEYYNGEFYTGKLLFILACLIVLIAFASLVHTIRKK